MCRVTKEFAARAIKKAEIRPQAVQKAIDQSREGIRPFFEDVNTAIDCGRRDALRARTLLDEFRGDMSIREQASIETSILRLRDAWRALANTAKVKIRGYSVIP